MPRLERKTRRRRELSFHELFAADTGLTQEGRNVRRMTDAEAADCWRDPAIRAQIMDAHMEHHRNGWPSRPWCWWRMEYGEDRPGVLAPAWAEAVRLLELDELDADEHERLPRLIRAELKIRRARVGMDAPGSLESLEALAARLGVEASGDE